MDGSPEIGGAKRVTTARLLAVIPGAGHVYAAEPGKGFAFAGGMAGVLAVGTLGVQNSKCIDLRSGDISRDHECSSTTRTIKTVTAVALAGIWVWNIADAGHAARRTNLSRGHYSLGRVAPVSASVSRDRRLAATIGMRVVLP